MRTFVLTLVALFAVMATTDAYARPKAKKKNWKQSYSTAQPYYGSQAKQRGYGSNGQYTRSQLEQLPIRITKPDNMHHYVYQNYPAWAADAMEPKRRW